MPAPDPGRPPGAADCDAKGRCWVFDNMFGLPSWTLIEVRDGKGPWQGMPWRPAQALPLPSEPT